MLVKLPVLIAFGVYVRNYTHIVNIMCVDLNQQIIMS